MRGELIAFPSWQKHLSPGEAKTVVERILAIPAATREKANPPGLNDPEVLLDLCHRFRAAYETSPSAIRDEAEFFYEYLSSPGRNTGSFDEREYFLGEFAMIAGTAARFLYRRDEARR